MSLGFYIGTSAPTGNMAHLHSAWLNPETGVVSVQDSAGDWNPVAALSKAGHNHGGVNVVRTEKSEITAITIVDGIITYIEFET